MPRRALELAEQRRHLLVGAVLQQAREQHVAGLEQREVLLVLHLGLREQARGLEVEQGRRDDEEAGGLLEVGVVAQGGGVGDEVVGDAAQGHLGDVELVAPDQLQQQVERAGEVVQADLEPTALRGLGRLGCFGGQRHRAMTSRARAR